MKEEDFLKEAQATVQARNPPKKENLILKARLVVGLPWSFHDSLQVLIGPERECIPEVQSFKCYLKPVNSLNFPNKHQREVPSG